MNDDLVPEGLTTAGLITEGLIAEARAFDDDALEALAGVGLLRRARRLLAGATASGDDASVDDASADEVSVDAATVRIGGQSVAFRSGSGLAAGTCSCSTAGVCQHLVAAILFLRELPGDAPAGDAGPITPDGLLRWLVTDGAADLEVFAGRAALRWAAARSHAADEASIVDGVPLVVRVAPGVEVRFVAPSLASAFCDPAGPHDRRHIALAVSAVLARHGSTLPTVPPPPPSSTRSALHEARSKVAASIAGAARDTVGIGIAHPSPTAVERFEALALDARGASLSRLSRIVAGIADGLEATLERRSRADPIVLAGRLALAHALAESLAEALAAGGELPLWLTGTARADYRPIGPFRALGLGSHEWTTASGFAGVTTVLFDATNGRFVEVGITQPSGGRPAAVGQLGWQGAADPGAFAGRWTEVSGASAASVGPDLRLSTASATVAVLGEPWSAGDLEPAIWHGEEPRRSTVLRGDRSDRWAVLQIDGADPAWFEVSRQRLIWPLHTVGRSVIAVVPWSARTASTIEAIEALHGERVSHVVGRLAAGAASSPTILPVSVVTGGRLQVLADRARRDASASPSPSSSPSPSAAAAPAASGLLDATGAVERLGLRLLELVERGVDESTREVVVALGRRAAEAGLPSLAGVLGAETTDPRVRVLRAVHLVEEHRALAAVDGSGGPTP